MADAQPIDPARFAEALQDLPVDALYSKVSELANSIAHLHSSNQQMLPFAEEGDQDCKDAMFENLGVIGRMNQRIQLIKSEVQRRGLRWTEGELEDAAAGKEPASDMVNGHGQLVNGNASNGTAAPTQSGSLTDAELLRRLQEQMAGDEDGVHL
ncbi:hypothetical protein AMS68_007226 [Peltaster fructicola]|uniref:Uncharacterized protein n=1 Tax=Peltaster fructicola TaxID=286661 RepID=A0A6H0Y4D4_9PEZI|nr:hypothetical protein AMS68_007226 [Peltaster fructicola]